MKTHSLLTFSICCLLLSITPGTPKAETTLSILKDGGGADLIENSLVAITVAVAQGADFIEVPINLSSDDQLIVFRDTTLNRLTNVADLFPERMREDGNYYVVDFSILELRQLRLRNVFEDDTMALSLGISTLQESLTVIEILNTQFNKDCGVVISLTQPGFYQKEGKSISRQLKKSLDLLSYNSEKKLFIESSDPDELQKISRWPQGNNSKKYSLIQSITLEPATGQDTSGIENRRIQDNWLFTHSGLRILASYANAVNLTQEIIDWGDVDVQGFTKSLHDYDIKVFGPAPTSTLAFGDSRLIQKEFDGIYIESLNSPQAQKTSVTETTQPDEMVENSSTLPPFFSNLGLSQPKKTEITDTFNNESSGKDLE